MNSLVRFLQSSRSTSLILLLTLLLLSPALVIGYFGDDYMHHALLSPEKPFPKPDDGSLFGLFSFIDGDPARNQQLRDYSLLSWWSYDALKFTFWRPISEISHWIDHRLWRDHPAIMHLHSILWYGLLCALVGLLYRQLASAPLAAGAALLIYALDSTHGFCVGWLSSRNALLAATFGMGSLLMYVRWHDTGRRLDQGLSLVLLGLSLLSAEAGVGTAAYLGAFALIMDRHGPLKGLMRLAPHAVLTIAWWITYKELGFGAANADAYYIDPNTSPGLFLMKMLERIPVMLGSQYGLIPAEVYGFAGKPVPAYVGLCVLYVAAVFALMRHTLRLHKTSRFWMLGSLFALVPVASALPADRNLLFVSIGGAMLIGEIFAGWIQTPKAQGFKQQLGSGVIALFLALHMVFSPLLLPLMAYSPRIWTQQMQLEAVHLPDIDTLPQKNLILAGTPLPAALGMVPVRYAEKLPLPGKVWLLTSQQKPLTLTRVSTEEIVISAEQGFVNETEESLRNTQIFPFTVGDKIVHTGMTLEVLSINEMAKPMSLRMVIAPEQVSNTLILKWQNGAYQVLGLPDVGSTITLAW
jgi:hypothetical protein